MVSLIEPNRTSADYEGKIIAVQEVEVQAITSWAVTVTPARPLILRSQRTE